MPQCDVSSPDAGISLRQATAQDAEFFYRLYASTRWEELAQTNWSDEQKAQFCAMQFHAQTADYGANYPHAQFSVIERQGEPAGRLIVDRRERAIHIIDIALIPEMRGQGTGTHLLGELMNEATLAGQPLSIHVETFNPALRLYQRLGFRPIEDKGVYLLMEWTPGAETPASDVPAASDPGAA
jgi:ribosomal protein S18 acetylase RimI-like enzyme